MKKLNASQWIIVFLVVILICQQLFMGNAYKKQYEKMLKEKEESFEVEIQKLNHINDSLFTLNSVLIEDIGTIDDKLDSKNAELARLRRKYNAQIDKLDDMSDDELAATFSNTFK